MRAGGTVNIKQAKFIETLSVVNVEFTAECSSKGIYDNRQKLGGLLFGPPCISLIQQSAAFRTLLY